LVADKEGDHGDNHAHNERPKINDSSKHNKGGLLAITCLCGEQILVIPDLKAMSEAIERHVAEHEKKDDSHEDKEAKSAMFRHFLIEQILLVASQQNRP
jgi:hypothetical protein